MSTVQQLLRRIEDFERTQKQLQEQILDIVNERDRANDRIDALERQLQQLQPQSSTEPRKAIWRSTATPDIEIISVGMAGPEELNSEVFKATAGDFSPIVIEEELAAVSELSEVQIIPRPVLASTALKTLPSSPHTNLPFFQSHFSKENPTLIAELQRPFVTSPAIPKSRFVKRSLLASNYCKNGEIYTTQTFQGPLAGRRVLYFSQPGQGEAPTDPGMSGMFLSIKPDVLFLADGQWKSVFGSKLDGSAEYYGEYMFRNLGTIPAELVVEGYARGMGLQHWYRQIREWPVSSSFLVLRARISLRNQNLTITQHVLDAEVEAIKSREGKALAHETRGAVRRAFESGDEKIHILSMTCVSYDDTFANEVFERCSQAAAKSNANCDQLSQSSNKRPSSPSNELVDTRDSKRLRESAPETLGIVSITQTVSTAQSIDANLPSMYPIGPELLRSYFYKDKQALLLKVSQLFEIGPAHQHTVKEKPFARAYVGRPHLQLFQPLVPSVSPARDVVYIVELSQPDAPKSPGEFGLLLVLKSDVQRLCDDNSKAVFSGRSKACRYLGEYKLTDLGNIPAELLTPVSSSYSQAMGSWYHQIREWPTRPAVHVARAKISLQAQGLPVTEETIQTEAKAIKVRSGNILPHETSAAIRDAFKSQIEVIHVLSMQCVSYDHSFIDGVVHRLSNPTPKQPLPQKLGLSNQQLLPQMSDPAPKQKSQPLPQKLGPPTTKPVQKATPRPYYSYASLDAPPKGADNVPMLSYD